MTLNLNNMSRKDLEKRAAQVKKANESPEVTEKRKAFEAATGAAARYGYSLSR